MSAIWQWHQQQQRGHTGHCQRHPGHRPAEHGRRHLQLCQHAHLPSMPTWHGHAAAGGGGCHRLHAPRAAAHPRRHDAAPWLRCATHHGTHAWQLASCCCYTSSSPHAAPPAATCNPRRGAATRGAWRPPCGSCSAGAATRQPRPTLAWCPAGNAGQHSGSPLHGAGGRLAACAPLTQPLKVHLYEHPHSSALFLLFDTFGPMPHARSPARHSFSPRMLNAGLDHRPKSIPGSSLQLEQLRCNARRWTCQLLRSRHRWYHLWHRRYRTRRQPAERVAGVDWTACSASIVWSPCTRFPSFGCLPSHLQCVRRLRCQRTATNQAGRVIV